VKLVHCREMFHGCVSENVYICNPILEKEPSNTLPRTPFLPECFPTFIDYSCQCCCNGCFHSCVRRSLFLSFQELGHNFGHCAFWYIDTWTWTHPPPIPKGHYVTSSWKYLKNLGEHVNNTLQDFHDVPMIYFFWRLLSWELICDAPRKNISTSSWKERKNYTLPEYCSWKQGIIKSLQMASTSFGMEFYILRFWFQLWVAI